MTRLLRLGITGTANEDNFRATLWDGIEDQSPVLAEEPIDRARIEGARWNPQEIRTLFHDTAGAAQVAELKEIGEQLAEWALPGKVGSVLDALRAASGGARLMLDVRAPSLADLPWELLRTKDSPNTAPKVNFLRKQTPISRFRRGGRLGAAIEWPLRLLLVVGAPDAAHDQDNIGADAMVSAIDQRLHPYGHSIDRETLERPTLSELKACLKDLRPHVLVFVGHGRFLPDLGDAVLDFQLQDIANSWSWHATNLADDLSELGDDTSPWAPTLVILNACRTHDPGASFQIADAFFQAGTLAAVAMQGDIRGDLAGVFTEKLLSQLCEQAPLDVAVTLARKAVKVLPGSGARDWAFPVLTCAADPGRIIPRRPPSTLGPRLAPVFSEICWSVDRRWERRQIRRELPIGNGASPGQGLIVLSGQRGCGKSHLARWCLEQLAVLYDFNVRYVEAAGAGQESFVSLLRRVCQPGGAEAFPPDVLSELHWKINALLAGQQPGPWRGGAIDDAGAAFDPAVVNSEHGVKAICDAFRDAFLAAARTRPLAIVLDQFVMVKPNGTGEQERRSLESSVVRDVLMPHFLRPAQEGKIPNVFWILGMEDQECVTYGIDSLVTGSRRVRLEPDFPGCHKRLRDELLWFPDPASSVDIDGLMHVATGVLLKEKLKPHERLPVRIITKLKEFAMRYFGDENEMRKTLKVQQMR